MILRQLYDISQAGCPKPAKILPVNDIEQIHEVKRALTRNMDGPPSLHQLGRQMGINILS